MIRCTSILAAIAIVVAAAFAAQTQSAPKAGNASWTTDLKAAMAESKESGKPILMNFTGSDWCGWCIKLHKEVFDKKEFKTWAKKNVVLMTIDFPRSKSQSDELKKQNRALAEQYGIRGFPTILFVNAEGKKLGESGYLAGGPKKWTANATQIIGKK